MVTAGSPHHPKSRRYDPVMTHDQGWTHPVGVNTQLEIQLPEYPDSMNESLDRYIIWRLYMTCGDLDIILDMTGTYHPSTIL